MKFKKKEKSDTHSSIYFWIWLKSKSCSPCLIDSNMSQKNSIKIKKGNDDLHSFILIAKYITLKEITAIYNTTGNHLHSGCLQVHLQKHLQSQKAPQIPKCSTTRALDFCHRVVSTSNNTFAMDIAKILHAAALIFFRSAQKLILNQTMFGNKTPLVVRCLIAFKQQYLTIKIAFICPIAGM